LGGTVEKCDTKASCRSVTVVENFGGQASKLEPKVMKQNVFFQNMMPERSVKMSQMPVHKRWKSKAGRRRGQRGQPRDRNWRDNGNI
jgi:hypothetical protein